MVSVNKPMYYWNKEKCQEIALKFESRSKFYDKYAGAYNSAVKLGILDEICSHMKVYGDLYKRLIYVCEFSDNNVYIGLTCDSDRRKDEHINTDINSSSYKHKLKTGLIPEYKELTDYINVEEAIIKIKYF